MDLQMITVSEVRQRKMKTAESKNDKNELIYKTENKFTVIKSERGINLGFGISR